MLTKKENQTVTEPVQLPQTKTANPEKGKKCCGDCKNGKLGKCHSFSAIHVTEKPISILNQNQGS